MKKPLISVIIRTKNNAETIARALDSTLKQTLSQNKFEIIIVNDGSRDTTIQKIKPYSEQINYHETSNLGAVQALNFGLEKATGKYYTILDADDALSHKALEQLLNKIQDTGASVVYGNYFEISESSQQKLLVDTSKNLFLSIAGGILFEKDIVLTCNKYDKSLFFPEYDLLIKIMKKYKIAHLNLPVYYYFRRQGSLTSSKDRVQSGINELRKKYNQDFPIRSY